MNKLLTLACATAVATMAAQANADEYTVSGTFTSPAGVSISLGGPDILSGGAVDISGIILTDTNTAGYNITGGTLTMTGTLAISIGGTNITVEMQNVSGTASNNGVIFDSGHICVTAATPCDTGLIDVSASPLPFVPGVSWAGGYNTTAGMQLTGGAGGATFTVAQLGNVATAGVTNGAAGAGTILGNSAGIFLGGNLTFSEYVRPPSTVNPNAIPTLPLYGLGMTVLGLALVAGRRLRQLVRGK